MAAFADESACVGDKVVDDLLQAFSDAEDIGGLSDDFYRAVAFLDERREGVGHVFGDGMKVHALHHDRVRSLFDMLKSEQFVRHVGKTLGFADDGVAEALPQGLRHIGVHERFGVASNCRQGCAQLVRDIADELGLALLLYGEVAHFGLRLFAQGGEVLGEQV